MGAVLAVEADEEVLRALAAAAVFELGAVCAGLTAPAAVAFFAALAGLAIGAILAVLAVAAEAAEVAIVAFFAAKIVFGCGACGLGTPVVSDQFGEFAEEGGDIDCHSILSVPRSRHGRPATKSPLARRSAGG